MTLDDSRFDNIITEIDNITLMIGQLLCYDPIWPRSITGCLIRDSEGSPA
jgi:hypothetical protein